MGRKKYFDSLFGLFRLILVLSHMTFFIYFYNFFFLVDFRVFKHVHFSTAVNVRKSKQHFSKDGIAGDGGSFQGS